MSLKPTLVQPVPKETVQVARAAFPKGNLYLTLRDKLGSIFQDEDFADLFPTDGQPALPPWRLALVTILQFRESLPDRQAAEAVRGRIDWKYLLGLKLTDAGFDFSVLSGRVGKKPSYWRSCWNTAEGWDWYKSGANSAPMLPVYWRPFGS